MVGHNEKGDEVHLNLKADSIEGVQAGGSLALIGYLKIADGLTANGSANVTISNVAPAGVGTATISKWLEIKDSDGTVFYIPCWT